MQGFPIKYMRWQQKRAISWNDKVRTEVAREIDNLVLKDIRARKGRGRSYAILLAYKRLAETGELNERTRTADVCKSIEDLSRDKNALRPYGKGLLKTELDGGLRYLVKQIPDSAARGFSSTSKIGNALKTLSRLLYITYSRGDFARWKDFTIEVLGNGVFIVNPTTGKALPRLSVGASEPISLWKLNKRIVEGSYCPPKEGTSIEQMEEYDPNTIEDFYKDFNGPVQLALLPYRFLESVKRLIYESIIEALLRRQAKPDDSPLQALDEPIIVIDNFDRQLIKPVREESDLLFDRMEKSFESFEEIPLRIKFVGILSDEGLENRKVDAHRRIVNLLKRFPKSDFYFIDSSNVTLPKELENPHRLIIFKRVPMAISELEGNGGDYLWNVDGAILQNSEGIGLATEYRRRLGGLIAAEEGIFHLDRQKDRVFLLRLQEASSIRSVMES